MDYEEQYQENQQSNRWELDANEIISEIYFRLTGKYYDEKKKKWLVSEEVIQTLDDDIVNEVMRKVRNYINPITQLSKLNERKIEKLSMEFYCDMLKIFSQNNVILSIDESFRQSIVGELTDFVHVTLMRSLGGFTQTAQSGMYKEVKSINLDQTPKRSSGVWDKFRGKQREGEN